MRRARRLRAALAGLLAAGALLGPLAGCSEPAAPVAPFRRLGHRAAQHTVPRAGSDARMAAARRWGLAAPLPPAPRPPARRAGAHMPFVVDRVAVRAKVVFLTFDDGPGDDPAFPRMVRDLHLPLALFLTGDGDGDGSGGGSGGGGGSGTGTGAGAGAAVASARARVDELRALGAGVHNHTLSHPDLRTLDYARQRAEICGQQDRLAARFASRPRLFRPPYGAYDAGTLRAARECGVRAVVLARVTMTADGPRYARGARSLRPGDIVRVRLPDPGASATRLTARLLEHIRARGFTVGRIEDYL
ncbi:polysaccharide deacetylase family protein [Streptomyces sp. NPDC048416]|uniref:polysaccharide deacetylase family protein n=1 Tax=Streptomyces sp. NPDC048416 TaxID=3365546 RepID=UPI00371921BD